MSFFVGAFFLYFFLSAKILRRITKGKTMLKKIFKVLFLSLFIFTISAMAWDDAGHKTIAYIAWERMSPEARERAFRILMSAPEDSDLSVLYPHDSRSEAAKRRELFQSASYWADIVRDRKFKERSEKYHKGNWHYDDTFWTRENGQVKIIENPSEDGGKAVEKIAEFVKVLQNPEAPDADKAIALAWIEHLVGDIHQPLHTSARVTELEPKGDQGGNTFLLNPKDTPREQSENLHWFWDSILRRNVSRNDECDGEYIPKIATQIMKKHAFAKMQSRLKIGDFRDWQKEGFLLATTDVFSPNLIRFEAPPAKYKQNAFEVAQEQMALAGYRLGEMLNRIFSIQTAAQADNSCRIVRKIMYPVVKKGMTGMNQSERIALLNVCFELQASASRPMIRVKTNGGETMREFDVIRVFANRAEAEKYAKENNITDTDFN